MSLEHNFLGVRGISAVETVEHFLAVFLSVHCFEKVCFSSENAKLRAGDFASSHLRAASCELREKKK